jgi:hypothetical protein
MDALTAITVELDEKVKQLKDHLAAGRATTLEEYKQLCGEIKGLLFARQYVTDLKRNLENSDDE